MITQVKFVSIPVEDQQRALDFYTEKLGFRVATDQPFGEGRRWIELKIGGAETRVVLWPGQPGGFQPLAWQADNVERTHEELAARGVEFHQPPRKEAWGTSAMFRDSEGNEFVLSSK